ncbi:YHYH protein [Dehalococcoidia bacterium]|nr:YHYH protein [Dehalococcoidia bacterium]
MKMRSISHTKIHYLCISSIAIFIVLFPLACNSQQSIETLEEVVTQEDSNVSNIDISSEAEEAEKVNQDIVELEPIPIAIVSIQPTYVPVPSATVTISPTRKPTLTVEIESPDQVIESSGNDNTDVPEYMKYAWLCTGSDIERVDDLTTPNNEDYKCSVNVEYTKEFAIVRSNGIPNHDYESGLGCCAAETSYEWTIPLDPVIASSFTYAPDRGAIAISVNGVPFFGPEEGPGGDAVALHFDYFVEDRQPIVLGLCGAHSAGTTFHYHFDGNCVHWHPRSEGLGWEDWDVSFLKEDQASPVIGFAFDGYPIYGPYGNDSNNQLKEMTSSYRLKQDKNGYGGIDDWEYVEGLGDLDECNGITSKVPDMEEEIYHYHASSISGSGEIGFPYFILCYKGIPEMSNMNQSGTQEGPAGGQQRTPPNGKPDCLPPNPPPGKDNYPRDWLNLEPC